MAIETSSSITVNSTSNLNQNSQSVSAKASSDSSFKDEMDKVSSTENSEINKDAKDIKDEKVIDNKSKNEEILKTDNDNKENNFKNGPVQEELPMVNIQQFSINNVNQMLVEDIQQMTDAYTKVDEFLCSIDDKKINIAMNETDAQFFIELTNTQDVNVQNMNVQAQNMVNSGADIQEVQQGYQVSQALLTALNESRQNNQPIRIDFDQNIAVILKVNQNGSISANFIPGDKAVEQYLRNNIDMLKNSFDEKNLPYTDLSYSNSSKEQNRRRRNEQQGE